MHDAITHGYSPINMRNSAQFVVTMISITANRRKTAVQPNHRGVALELLIVIVQLCTVYTAITHGNIAVTVYYDTKIISTMSHWRNS